MSMYRQLWLAIIASMLLALAGSLLASMLSARGYLESQLSIKNTDNASALALALSQNEPDPISVELAVSALFDSGHYELIRVVDPLGKAIVERRAAPENLGAPAWFVRLLPIRATPGSAQISNGWQQFGTLTLISHSRFAYAALWQSVLEMIGALVLAGCVGVWLGSLILRRLRRPLDAVVAQAKAISERRFITIDEPRVPELRQLALAMNTTVARLKGMFAEEAARLEAVRREANFDALTGLANRSHFMARLRQTLDAEDGFGGQLLLVRLIGLADLNRRLGRAATDDFLKRYGEIIAQCAADCPQGIVARLNGADFALMLAGESEGRPVAERLSAGLSRLASPLDHKDVASAIGYARYERGMDLGALLARVDGALAGAESEGGKAPRAAVAEGETDRPRSAEQWSAMIRQALANQWVKLIAFPVVEFSGRLSHRECPLRLKFEEEGEWLPAGQFLPIAERLRLTPELDLAAVELGLREIGASPDLPGLAINLSPGSLVDADFQSELLKRIAAHRHNVPRLWLDFTEIGALRHIEAFRTLCRQLKSLGCRVGLEHFGHQFNQIGQLHDLGLDYLKIDSSFIRGIDGNAGNAAFLKGLANIAHAIGLQVLAEGVASRAEMEALAALGFDGATGPAVKDPA